jgi:RsiW-degrading membrane proteinase PrsW (M82 family)
VIESAKFAVGLIPVFVFLTALIILDSYKLVSLRSVLLAILGGIMAAALSYLVNSWILKNIELHILSFTRYVAPFLEEILKSLYLVYLIRSKKVGFMVDSGIFGFAIGAGFAMVENIYYLQTLESSNVLLWVIRGFGTAVMHGGTMAIFGIISKGITDRHNSYKLVLFLPGLGIAILAHMIFNFFIISPFLNTIIILTILPLIIVVVFDYSEKVTRNWLGIGMDTDVELMEMITSGRISETRVGQYLHTIKNRFPGEVVIDILCYLRLYLELSVGAKGLLMMRKAGFKVSVNTEIEEKLKELKYLEKSIGKTGKLAVLPFLHTSSHDIWQLKILQK